MKKFVSKQSNYRVVLRHGQPAEPLTGRNAVPGIYVKFENGIVTINDEETCEMMMKHPGFNADFILVEEGDKDPWKDDRRETEPEHNVTEIKYGHVEKSIGKPISPFTRDQQIAMKKMAEEMAVKMAPEIAMQMLEKSSPKKGIEENAGMAEPFIEKEEKIGISNSENICAGLKVAQGLKNEEKEIKKPFCDKCASKGVKHLKDCPNNPNNKKE